MPRVTSQTYLKQRAHLRHLWFDENGRAFSYLSAIEQLDLHALYAITEQLNDRQVAAYRSQTSKEDPSLPQRAGRAYANLVAIEQYLASLPPPAPVVRGSGKRRNRRSKDARLSVRALVNPTIDYEKLASALLQHADDMRRKQEDEESTAA